MGKFFCIPFNGDFKLIEKLLPYSDYIYEFYGSDGFFQRSAKQNEYHNLNNIIPILRSKGIQFNYVLNSLDFNDTLNNITKILDYLPELKKMGIKSITTNFPLIVNHALKHSLEVNSSVCQFIDSELKVKQLESIGYDRITLSEDMLRQIQKIKYIRDITKKPIEILINNGCSIDCIFKTLCYSIAGRVNKETEETRKCLACSHHYSKYGSPEEELLFFLKTNWIRFKDITRYKQIGVNLFKLSGGDSPTDVIIDVFKSYALGEISTLSLIKSSYTKYLNDDNFDEYFDFFWKGDGCSKKCSVCQWCENQARRIFENFLFKQETKWE
jgi:collagenase-like PrtC family protease